MAFPGQILTNPQTGQTFRFIQTAESSAGEVLEIESSWQPHSVRPPSHYHPKQNEEFQIIQGQLTVVMDGKTNVLKEGDSIYIPSNTVHAMWNSSEQVTMARWYTRPALKSELLFETFNTISEKGKRPSVIRLAVILNYFRNEFRLAKPPYGVQRILFAVLGNAGRLIGMSPVQYGREQKQDPVSESVAKNT